jgi:hypothetical protein
MWFCLADTVRQVSQFQVNVPVTSTVARNFDLSRNFRTLSVLRLISSCPMEPRQAVRWGRDLALEPLLRRRPVCKAASKRILTEEALELLAIIYVQTSEAHSECSSVSVGASNTRFGSCRTKTVFPGMDSSRFRQPPCSRAACSAIDSPRPVPLTFSALTNG